jgi:hypothetical protein
MWMWILIEAICMCFIAVAEREPHDLGQCSHFHIWAAFGGTTSAPQARGTLARRCRSTRR